MKFIGQDVKRCMRRYPFWIAVSLIVFCFAYEHNDYFFDNVWGNLDVFYLYIVPFDFSLFFLLIPFAATLPASFTHIEDMKTNNIRFRLYRSTYAKYIQKKIAAISVTTILASLIGCLIFMAFAFAVSPLEGRSGLEWRTYADGLQYEWFARKFYGIPYMFEVTLRVMITCWLWGLIGLWLNIVWENKAITLIVVFLLFYCLDFIVQYLGLTDWRPFLLFHSQLEYRGSIAWRYFQNGILLFVMTGIDLVTLRLKLKRI